MATITHGVDSLALSGDESELDLDADDYAIDSAYDSELASYTTSLASSVTDYKTENGRRYHAFRGGMYHYPNDEVSQEKEMDRLDITHKMIQTALGGKLFLAPLQTPSRILDIGTGTGIWAMEVGDCFPQADVLGNDLSPIQPKWVPPNVHFEVDDAEAEWTYSAPFDFIHCRCLYTSIRDWPRLVRQAYNFTRPGGLVEFCDVDLQWRSPDDSLKGSSAELTNTKFIEAMEAVGLEPNPGRHLKKWITDQGFEAVHERDFVIPFGTWPADKHLKEVGAWSFLQAIEGLESFFMATFTRLLKWKKEEVDELCSKVRQNLKDPRFHAYFKLHNVWARKPGNVSDGLP